MPSDPDERPDVLRRIELASCPDHRLAMVRFTRTPIAEWMSQRWWPTAASAAHADLMQSVGAAQMWWVSRDMQLLVEAATESLPDFRLSQSDVPDPFGIVFYARPLAGIDAFSYLDDDLPLPEAQKMDGGLVINAMSWSAHSVRRDGSGVLTIWSWVYLIDPQAKSGLRGWRPLGVSTWDLGARVTEVREDYSEQHQQSVIEDRRRLAALWLLAAQESVAAASTERVDRPAAKRHVRAGFEVPTMRVLRLRHKRNPQQGETAAEVREWTHRWVVSGHWRNQWLPSEDRHRPTWIAPYVKGPDDKPLVLKESVKALVR